ncbi:MAG: hypothetical protein ACJ75B_07940 [Flavisolibacter sp.]|jgi:hypothetical protein
MGELLFFREFRNKNQFKIDYPYYGLFGSADITVLQKEEQTLYECRLLNGSIVCLRKQPVVNRWIDAGVNGETPLSITIGEAIDDFLKKNIS